MKQNGQSLIEMVVAIALAMLVIIAITTLSTTGIKNAQSSKNKELAEKLAQEGIEWIRSQRDSQAWSDMWNKAGSTAAGLYYCLPDTSGIDISDLTSSFTAEPEEGICPYLIGNIHRRHINLVQNGCMANLTKAPDFLAAAQNPIKAVVVVQWKESTGGTPSIHESRQESCLTNWLKK